MESTISIRYHLTAAELCRAHQYHVSHTCCLPVFRLILHSGFALLLVLGCVLLFRWNQIADGISVIFLGISWFTIVPVKRRRAADSVARRKCAGIADKGIEIEWLVGPAKLVNNSGPEHKDYT